MALKFASANVCGLRSPRVAKSDEQAANQPCEAKRTLGLKERGQHVIA